MRRLQLDVLGISEVRWLGVGCLENPSGGTFIYLGGQDAKRGVGIMLNKNMKSHIIGYWACLIGYFW